MGKTYTFPEDIKALLIFEIGGEEVFISPMQQHDIRMAYQIYKTPALTAEMINLLQVRKGSEAITPEMVKAVIARPLQPSNEVKSESKKKAAPQASASAVAESVKPETVAPQEQQPEQPIEPPSPVVEDEETFDLWGQALHIPVDLQQDIRCAYRILGSAEAAAQSINRVKKFDQEVTVDMVQAVITRCLRQEGLDSAD